MNYLTIESVSGEAQDKVKQNLKFKTGKFVWRVKFTAPLDPATINNMNLYVTNLAEQPLKTSVRYDADENFIEIEPLEAYAKDSTYVLNISRNVRSRGGQTLKNDVRVKFKV